MVGSMQIGVWAGFESYASVQVFSQPSRQYRLFSARRPLGLAQHLGEMKLLLTTSTNSDFTGEVTFPILSELVRYFSALLPTVLGRPPPLGPRFRLGAKEAAREVLLPPGSLLTCTAIKHEMFSLKLLWVRPGDF